MKKRMFWKKAAAALLVSSLMAGLAGCQGGTKEAPVQENVAEGDKKGVKIRFVQEKLNDAGLKKTYEEIIEEYEKQSGVDVELEVVSGDFRVWLTTQYTANNAPDVVVTNYNYAHQDYKKGYVVDFGEYIDKPNPYNDDKPLRETVRASLLQECVDPDNGAVPVLPYAVNGVRIIYNKNAFEEAGITKTPRTYDEFIEACKKLQAMGMVPISFANPGTGNASMEWWLDVFLAQMDEKIRQQMDENGDGIIQKNELVAATDKGMIDFTKEPYSKAYEMLKDLTKYCNSDYNGTTEDKAIELFMGQKAAMTLMIMTRMRDIKAVENMGFEYDIMQMPLLTEDNYSDVTGKSTYIGGKLVNGYIVTKNSDTAKQEAAIDFVNYMLSPAAVKKLVEKSMVIPPINDVELGEGGERWIPTESESTVKCVYFGKANFKEFVDFNILSGQLYLAGDIGQEEFLAGLNEEWKNNCEKVKQENGWSEENNYGNKKTETSN